MAPDELIRLLDKWIQNECNYVTIAQWNRLRQVLEDTAAGKR